MCSFQCHILILTRIFTHTLNSKIVLFLALNIYGNYQWMIIDKLIHMFFFPCMLHSLVSNKTKYNYNIFLSFITNILTVFTYLCVCSLHIYNIMYLCMSSCISNTRAYLLRPTCVLKNISLSVSEMFRRMCIIFNPQIDWFKSTSTKVNTL